jgi:hypothetical protein
MKSRLIDLFSPINFPNSEEKNRISRILYLFWLSTCVLVALNIFGTVLVFVQKTGASVLILFFIGMLVIVRYFHWHGNLRLASFLFVLGVWIAYMAVTMFSGTIRMSAITISVAVVAMVIPLIGLSIGLASAIITLLITLGLSLLEIYGFHLPAYFPRNPLSNWFHLVTAFTIILIPLGQAWRDISKALAQARKSKNKHRLF